MKTKVLSLISCGIVLLFSSCDHECYECHYEDASNTKIELGEKCEDELENLEANGITIDSVTYEVHCHEH